MNLYLNGQLTVDHPLQRALHAWVTRTVAEVYADWPVVHLVIYSFIVNPAGNREGQPFHCDYTPTSSTLFVPLTPVSVLNATQFIPRPLERTLPNERVEFRDRRGRSSRPRGGSRSKSPSPPRPFTLVPSPRARPIEGLCPTEPTPTG